MPSVFHASNLPRAIAALSLAFAAVLGLMGLAAPRPAFAQQTADIVAYDDSLECGWQDWSWTSRNLAVTSPVYSGTDSIWIKFGAGQSFYLHHNPLPGSAFSALSFYLNGGTAGGQKFQVEAVNSSGTPQPGVPVTNYIAGGKIPANTWVHITIPLSDLSAASLPDLSGFWLQDTTGTTQSPLYIDQVVLVGPTPPASVSVSVDATKPLRAVDERVFGVNTEAWDGNTDTNSTKQLMVAAGAKSLRWPGGSWGDTFDWTVQKWAGQTQTPQFADLAGTLGAHAFVIANYGTGSAQMAAAWVAYCNASVGSATAIGSDPAGRDWHDSGYWAALRAAAPLATDDGLNFLRISHQAPFHFQYWEIGNECYGSWEADNHAIQHDPATYASFLASAGALMKSVDPTIKIGAVMTNSEDGGGSQAETVTNPVTGVQHKGWTSVVLSTLASLHSYPDFGILHNYPEGGASDADLLHLAQLWPSLASSMRTMLNQYFGTSAASAVEIVCTENNAAAVTPGKQSTSLVNGLFYADSTAEIMTTEFNANIWWDLHNGTDTTADNSPLLYGWRLYGDYGLLSPSSGLPGASVVNTPYPPYFGMKLLTHFAHQGDSVLACASSYINLATYAVKQPSGKLAVLILNKEPATDLPATISFTGFAPGSSATIYQYGKPQDTAQSTGASVDLAQSTLSLSGSKITATFPSYSMTVLIISPSAPAAPTALTAIAS